MFWFKQKELVIEFFTTNPSAFELAKPDHAVKFIPDWWKNIPPHVIQPGEIHKSPTMKRCAGFVEHYKHGFMLPIWSDLNIQFGPIGTTEYKWQFSDRVSVLDNHNFKQTNNYLREEEVLHVKLINPWVFKCDEDVPWVWTSPSWNTIKTNNVYSTLQGTVEYKYQHTANINMLIYKNHQWNTIHIPFRTPIAHAIPLTTRPLKIVHHLAEKTEFDMLYHRAAQVKFLNKYKIVRNLLKGDAR